MRIPLTLLAFTACLTTTAHAQQPRQTPAPIFRVSPSFIPPYEQNEYSTSAYAPAPPITPLPYPRPLRHARYQPSCGCYQQPNAWYQPDPEMGMVGGLVIATFLLVLLVAGRS